MNVENLVYMANRIGEYFLAYPDHEDAKREIADHLQKFWAARMRIELLAHIDTVADTGLDPLVLDAVRESRNQLTPASHAQP